MTPKEKAEELVDNFYQLAENIQWTNDDEKKEKSEKFNDELGNDVLIFWNELAKQSALIAVDEMLSEYQSMSDVESVLVINDEVTFVVHQLVYWMEVKQEIEKL
jgi:hypothetical protein